MTDRPIIFSGPMVRALLAGRKTQTRRIIRNMPEAPSHDSVVHPNPKHEQPYFDAYCGKRRTLLNPRGMSNYWCWWTRDDREGRGCKIRYVPGDRLYVREAWAPLSACTHNDPGTQAMVDRGFYRADNATIDGEVDRWRPSIHMPRSASRLTLIVEDVKVERLQAISEADAIAEGMSEPSLRDLGGDLAQAAWSERQVFGRLWSHLHGAGSWIDNPFVVALTFRVEHGNIDRISA